MNREDLHAYFDGELNAEETARMERALASDPALAAELATLRATDAALDGLPSASIDGDDAAWAQSVLARDRVPSGGGRLLRLLVPVAAAATIAFFLVPRADNPAPAEAGIFSQEETLEYVYWEADSETYGSGDLGALEDDILAELGDS
ncbi:MAG: zf-HC2 domain-containing protein [Planctomycetota bacterium]